MREDGLAGVGEVVVIKNKVEQHTDQVDHIRFLVGNLLLAGKRAMGLQLLLQIGFQAFYWLWAMQAL